MRAAVSVHRRRGNYVNFCWDATGFRHLLLYLYEENDKQYVIHASGNSLKVQIDSLDNVNGINLYPDIICISSGKFKKLIISQFKMLIKY